MFGVVFVFHKQTTAIENGSRVDKTGAIYLVAI